MIPRRLWVHQDTLTISAADESTANIDGREIRVGVNPGLTQAMERGMPRGRCLHAVLSASHSVSGQNLLCSGGLTCAWNNIPSMSLLQ